MLKVICLLGVGILLACSLPAQEEKLSPAEMRQEQKFARKEAEAWVKEEMTTRKKVIACLRKIKDERSANKETKTLLTLLENEVGTKTALGEVGEVKRPTGEAMEEEDKKRGQAVVKQKKQIKAELKRINQLFGDDAPGELINVLNLVEAMP